MKKVLALVAPFILLVAFAAEAGADKPGTAKISIRSIPSVYGYVKSSRTNLCAGRRTLTVFKKKEGKDKKIASTRTREFRGAWQWSIKKKPNGKIYARSDAKMGCSKGQSKSIRVTPLGDTPAPPCPSLATGICSFGSSASTALRLGSSTGCPSYQRPSDSCDGDVVGGPAGWRQGLGNIHWNGSSGDTFRGVAYYNSNAFLEGSMPGFRSNDFSIRDAFTPDAEGAHFCTPNLPGKAAGSRGGPLHFAFSRTNNVSYFSIYGFLVKKSADPAC